MQPIRTQGKNRGVFPFTELPFKYKAKARSMDCGDVNFQMAATSRWIWICPQAIVQIREKKKSYLTNIPFFSGVSKEIAPQKIRWMGEQFLDSISLLFRRLLEIKETILMNAIMEETGKVLKMAMWFQL